MTTPTDSELMRFTDAFDWEGWVSPALAKRAFARAVLAKWGHPQAGAGGEPVAWVDERAISWLGNSRSRNASITTQLTKERLAIRTMPLYTAPPPQAVREPFTQVQQERLYRNRPTDVGKSISLADWRRTVVFIERAHGITKGGQHGD